MSDANFAHMDTPQWFEDDDGGERLSFFFVKHDTTDEEVEAWVKRNFPQTHCQHSHDCCAQLYANTPRHWRIPHHERLVVHQTFRRNI